MECLLGQRALAIINVYRFALSPRKKGWPFQVDGKIEEVIINGRINGNNLYLLRNAALAGLGVINIPVWMVESDICCGGLVLLLESFSTSSERVPINAVFANDQHLAPKVRAFIDYLVEQTVDSSLFSN